MTEPGDCLLVGAGPPPRGEAQVPGDKSISQRAVLLGALGTGSTRIRGFLRSEDCLATLQAVAALGCRTRTDPDGTLRVEGRGGLLEKPARDLYLGNSGTGMRLLAGILAAQPFSCTLTGDPSLSRRPMGRLREPLERMGARIELQGGGACAPMTITGGALQGLEYRLPVASAQVKSALLLAGLFATGETVLTEPAPSRDHTERMLRAAGVHVRSNGLQVGLQGAGPGRPRLPARTWEIPGDFSSAAFLIAAAGGREGSELTLRNVGLNPRRTALLHVLRRMGADVDVRVRISGDAVEPVGDLTVRGRALRAVEVGGDEIPSLIDEVPLVAVLGMLARGVTRIRDAAELRFKESDRIEVMAAHLRAVGARVETSPDGLSVWGPVTPRPSGVLDSHGDHRIAMAMAVLGSAGGTALPLSGCSCTTTSYPGFWETLKRMGVHVQPR